MRQETTTCCIAGGGPAGMMAGLLLARQGIEVMVLEKHADFPTPLAYRLMRYVPALRHAFGWFIGRGIRPEHIPAVSP